MFIGSINVNADDIDFTIVNNGIMLISCKDNKHPLGFPSENKTISYKKAYYTASMLSYRLQLYTDGTRKQYAIKLGLLTGSAEKYAYIIPSKAKLLLKMDDDSVVELTSIQSEQDGQQRYYYGYFPISEELLEKANDGIKKMRFEILTLDVETNSISNTYREINYKKDKMGKQLKEWYDEINEEKDKQLNKLKQSQRDVRDNF